MTWVFFFSLQETTSIQDLPGLPAGVKFDPTDQELLEHLEGKARPDSRKLHPLVDEFIPTIEGENGICYTHPERLPGTKRERTFCASRTYVPVDPEFQIDVCMSISSTCHCCLFLQA